MNTDILLHPCSLGGKIPLHPSKSYLHRLIITSYLACGNSKTLHLFDEFKDIQDLNSTIDGMNALLSSDNRPIFAGESPPGGYFPRPSSRGGIDLSTLYLKNKVANEIITQYAGDISHEDDPRHVTHIPTEGDLFQAHHNHAGRTADDQHRTAHAGTISQQLPEDAVDSHVTRCSYGIHPHATGHQGYVIDDTRQDTDHAGHYIMIATGGRIERLAQGRQHAHLGQAGNRHQDAEEEHDGGQIDFAEQPRHPVHETAFLQLVVPIENLRRDPQGA